MHVHVSECACVCACLCVCASVCRSACVCLSEHALHTLMLGVLGQPTAEKVGQQLNSGEVFSVGCVYVYSDG